MKKGYNQLDKKETVQSLLDGTKISKKIYIVNFYLETVKLLHDLSFEEVIYELKSDSTVWFEYSETEEQ